MHRMQCKNASYLQEEGTPIIQKRTNLIHNQQRIREV